MDMADKTLKWEVVELGIPEGCNIILGQSHFIKTVEDLYEVLVTSSPALEFGLAFCEASGPCLVRKDGNADDLVEAAVANALKLSAGHFHHPDGTASPSASQRRKAVQEVCRVFATTANPLHCSSSSRAGAGHRRRRGRLPEGVESEGDVEERKKLLRDIIGYKR